MKVLLTLGADHAGFALKERLGTILERLVIAYEDVGTHSTDSIDCPDFVHRIAGLAAATLRGCLWKRTALQDDVPHAWSVRLAEPGGQRWGR